MSPQRGLQRAGRSSQSHAQARDLHHPALDLSQRKYLTPGMGADYLGFVGECDDPVKAFRQWAARHQVPIKHRGFRSLLFRRADIDAAVENPECFTCRTR